MYLERIERDAAFAARPIAFDLAAVVLKAPSEGAPAANQDKLALLSRDLRRRGLERVRVGRDHPVFGHSAIRTVLRGRLGLSERELACIAAGARRR